MRPVVQHPDGAVATPGLVSPGAHESGMKAAGVLVSGVVLRTYPDEEDAPVRGVTCDVLTERGTILKRIPVLQHGGTEDAAMWYPKPCSNPDPAMVMQDPDGERVIVAYTVSGMPMIIGALQSSGPALPRAENDEEKPDGTSHPALAAPHSRVLVHRGTKVIVDPDGNVAVDFSDSGAKLYVQADGGARFNFGDGYLELSDGKVVVHASRIEVEEPGGGMVVTTNHFCPFISSPHVQGSLKVKVV